MSRSLDAARSFVEQLEARGGREGAILASEFSDIRARSAAWKSSNLCSTEAGSRPGNVRKNRYKDVLPYDQTRVILSLLQEEGHGDYINGNFIRGTDGSQAYIATQGPLPHTLLDFWRMVWEFGVKVILMACGETENGRKKCECYWAREEEPLQTGLFCITLTRETWLNVDIMLRTLQVTFQKESRSVYQLQYMSWPDKGVPSNPDHVLAMVEEARRLQGSGLSPLCVHCRNSTGSCTKRWLRCSSQHSKMPAPITRTSGRIVPHSMMMPSPSGLPRPFLPYPAYLAGSSGASRYPGPRPSPWPTRTRWCRSAGSSLAPAWGRGRAARRRRRSTARWRRAPGGPRRTQRTRGGRSPAAFLLTKALLRLAPTRTWRRELRPVG
ncbi:tyrosine-protein phosphatase non-receptor type 18 isoform X3 [Diceros bicornis minor]|uniref:tyrosine-protein phosphatase non-receptor type 18 isoform X3 n=1 Tax=Diceros bicornis minor TaxID=77932 RepID=UPI0026F2E074|nr:tyrosine-protein phosphatase non-receptor type 18 isoform X3 [Diceros bicornis minor]